MPKLFQPRRRIAFFVGALLLPLSLAATTNASRASGKILDPSGAPVAGAHLELVNSAGAVTREAKSKEQGDFIFDGVESGEYQLRAEEQALVSVTLDVSISRGQQKQVTLQFRQLISVSQSITVVASAPSLLTPDQPCHGTPVFERSTSASSAPAMFPSWRTGVPQNVPYASSRYAPIRVFSLPRQSASVRARLWASG